MYYLPEECSEEDIEVAKPNLVRCGLYISGYESTECKSTLQKENITHILNLRGGKKLFPKEFTYLIFEDIVDMPNQDILTYFPQCIEFIEEGRKSGGVLIHCAAGVSRSATIVCAYLMATENLTLTEAIEEVRKCRPCICPNHGFKKQLQLWHQMNFTLEGKTKAHRLYKLQRLSKGFDDDKKELCFAEDLTQQSTVENIYACNSCRRKLFTESNIIEHDIDEFNLFGRYFDRGTCDSFYIEPIEWMSSSVQPKIICNYNRGELEELRCPNRHCMQILGTWTLCSTMCNCKATVCPSFQIKKHKVMRLENNFEVSKIRVIPQFTTEPSHCILLSTIVN